MSPIFILVWGKVKAAVKNVGDKISEKTKNLIDTLRPKIVEALKNVQRVIIVEGKKLIIEINGSIVKIITDGLTATSEDKSVSKRSLSDSKYQMSYGKNVVFGNRKQKLLLKFGLMFFL